MSQEPDLHQITLDLGASITRAFRARFPNEVFGGSFPKDVFHNLLKQKGVENIGFYFAISAENKLTIVLVGQDEFRVDKHTGYLAELATPCPPCAGNNPLNT